MIKRKEVFDMSPAALAIWEKKYGLISEKIKTTPCNTGGRRHQQNCRRSGTIHFVCLDNGGFVWWHAIEI